ncbi:MAG: RagB/SusD family nutrient uptake outer membrane protein [Hymenobacter sp.]|nr:MAG: RagB/SusD family nutrient uptake outer membrane protein [Hymenobacter sp.]
MKKSLFLLSGLAALLATTSCKKDFLEEDPRSILTPSFLGTPDGVQAGLTGTYSGLRNVFGNEEAEYMAVQGTDEFMRGIAANQGYEDYNRGLLNSTNSAATNQWGIMYRYINGANGVIQYATSVQGIAPATVTQVVAEAKVLRAVYYFMLVQLYGDVPLQLTFVDVPTKDIKRAPVADVYTAIIKDLTDALGGIADKPAQPGRVTRATALHVLSKVYLTRATSPAKQSGDYASAAQYATELLANQARYGVGLEANTADVFREGNENGKEVLMNVQFSQDATFSGQNAFDPTGANQTNFFFRSRYDLLPNLDRSTAYGRPYARFTPTPFLIGSYILPGETGRQVGTTDTRWTNWWTTTWLANSPGLHVLTGGRVAALGDTAAQYYNRELLPAERTRINSRAGGAYVVGTPANFTTQFSPVMNKYDDATRTGVNNPSDRPLIVYRLADTYLIAAEANFYLGKLDDARGYLNTVRERAGAAGKKTQMDINNSQITIDFILDERARELCGEQMRWMDLVRTGKLYERVQKYVPALTTRTAPPGGTDTYGSDAAKNIVAGNTPTQFLLRPIPQTEIDRTTGQPSGGITQNPGY